MARAVFLGDGGTNAAAITVANAGRKAGTAIDGVSTGTGTLTYDTSKKFFGTASARFTSGGGAANVWIRWDNLYRPAVGADQVASIWMYFTGNPSTSTSVLFVANGSSERVCEVRIISTGKVQAYNAAGVAQVATTTSIATNEWVRADVFFTPHASAGKLRIKLYNDPTNSTPTETTAEITGVNLRQNDPTLHLFGIANGSLNKDFNLHCYISDTGPAPFGTGMVLSRWVGGVASTSAKVAARVVGAAAVRLKVSTAADLNTSPVFSSSVAPDSNGTVRLEVTGLSPTTTYHYGLEVDGSVDTPYNGTFRTLPTPGVPASFSFAAASCARNNSNAATFDAIRARTGPDGRTALFMQHLGDAFYFAENTFVEADFHGAWDKMMSGQKQLDFFAKLATHYTWSDHDSGGSNHDGSSAAMPHAQTVFRSRVPSVELVDADGIYYSYVVGRVKFIVTDGRSFMDPIADTDDASKTKLGTIQKQWLKDELADPDYPLKVWFHEDAFLTGATFVGDDTWSAYDTERQELATYISSNDINVIYVHGDYHVLAYDDGTNTPGGFPVYCVSPLDNTGFIGSGTFSGGRYPPENSEVPNYYEAYGWFDVLDYGTSIAVQFSGRDSGDTERLSFDAPEFELGGPLEVTGELNRLARTIDYGAAAAANRYAGTTGLEVVGALNVKAGNSLPNYLDLQGVANQLAGTSALATPEALSRIPTPA